MVEMHVLMWRECRVEQSWQAVGKQVPAACTRCMRAVLGVPAAGCGGYGAAFACMLRVPGRLMEAGSASEDEEAAKQARACACGPAGSTGAASDAPMTESTGPHATAGGPHAWGGGMWATGARRCPSIASKHLLSMSHCCSML